MFFIDEICATKSWKGKKLSNLPFFGVNTAAHSKVASTLKLYKYLSGFCYVFECVPLIYVTKLLYLDCLDQIGRAHV